MRRIGPFLSTTLVALALVLALPPGIQPAAAGGAPNPIKAALQAGADRLVSLQNPDGGWFWTVGDLDCGLGVGISCANTFGVTALGLVNAYRVTHDPDHLAAAKAAGDALVATHAAGPACDADPATGADRPYTVDTYFLMAELAKVTHGSTSHTYRNVASDWFACVIADFPNAADRADNRIDRRIGQGLNNLGAWDAGLDIRAAIALHERSYALAEALQVIARQVDWDLDDPDCPGCQTLAKGLLLAAMKPLRGNPTVRAALADWQSDILALQMPDGSWNGDTQITSYVLMGLDETSQSKAVRKAIKKGTAFLFSIRLGLGNGGFGLGVGFETDENTEVDSEALQALFAVRDSSD